MCQYFTWFSTLRVTLLYVYFSTQLSKIFQKSQKYHFLNFSSLKLVLLVFQTTKMNQNTNVLYSVSVANSVGAGNRAPILVPSEYPSWVDRMRYYLTGHESDIWTYISTGEHNADFLTSVTVPNAEVSAETRRNMEAGISRGLTARQRKQVQFEAKAMQELLSGVPHDIYEQLPDEDKTTPFKVWTALKR